MLVYQHLNWCTRIYFLSFNPIKQRSTWRLPIWRVSEIRLLTTTGSKHFMNAVDTVNGYINVVNNEQLEVSMRHFIVTQWNHKVKTQETTSPSIWPASKGQLICHHTRQRSRQHRTHTTEVLIKRCPSSTTARSLPQYPGNETMELHSPQQLHSRWNHCAGRVDDNKHLQQSNLLGLLQMHWLRLMVPSICTTILRYRSLKHAHNCKGPRYP